MALCVNDSGTWREISTLCVNDSGTWRETATGCINQSGTWRCFGFTATIGGTSLGGAVEGGYLICKASGIGWIVAPSSTEVTRTWYARNDAVTTANASAPCGDWFVPTAGYQLSGGGPLYNPGYVCRTYWDSYAAALYWSNFGYFQGAYALCMANGGISYCPQPDSFRVRAFRCVSY